MMDQDEVEDHARRAGMSPEEYCLRKIREWESMLANYRDDYRNLSEEEFEERAEQDS